MDNKFKTDFKKSSLFIITFLIINFCWIGLEYTFDGQVISQFSDTVFGIILAWLLSEKIYIEYLYKRGN